MRATSETLAPGSSDAATSRSFSSCDHRRRRSTDVITSALEIVIALLLGLPLGRGDDLTIWGFLDDRFHETGIEQPTSMELEVCWWILRLRKTERGTTSWQP